MQEEPQPGAPTAPNVPQDTPAADLPIELPEICSKCLGDAPTLTLCRDLKGQQCRLCTRPFATFSWRKRRNGPKEISRFCLSCAERKNVCQSCYRNFDTGLPLSVHESAAGAPVNAAPQAFKYAAVMADAQVAAQASKHEYDKRLAKPILAIEAGAAGSAPVVEQLKSCLLAVNPPETNSLVVANCDSSVKVEALRARLAEYGVVEELRVVAAARCGFVRFASAHDAAKAMSTLPRGIFILDQTKLRLVWGEPLDLAGSEKEAADLIQQFMRGKLAGA